MSQPLVRWVLPVALLTLACCGEILGIDGTDLAESTDGGSSLLDRLPQRGLNFQRSPITSPSAGATSMDAGGAGVAGRDAGNGGSIEGGAGTAGSSPVDAGSDSAQEPSDDAGGADEDAGFGEPEWQPTEIPGLVVWLDAAHGVTTSGSPSHLSVSTWKDRSGRGNDAIQSKTELQPRLVAGAVNGRPAIEFNGRNTVLNVADNDALNFGTDDFTVEVVVAWSNPSDLQYTSYGYGAIVRKQRWNDGVEGIALWANALDGNVVKSELALSANSTLAMTALLSRLNNRKFRLCAGHREGPKVGAQVNSMGTDWEAIASDLNLSSAGAPLEIGGSSDTAQSLDGAIAEVVIVGGSMTPEQSAQLKAYFNAKYALWE